MATSQVAPSIVTRLLNIARDVHDIAFDFMEPARDRRDAEARIVRVEELAARLRATVRGHG